MVSIATQSLPNQVKFEFINNFDVFITLFDLNVINAIQLFFIQKPIIIIQNIDLISSTQTWGIYIMPISFVFLFILAAVLSIFKKRGLLQKNVIWLCVACFMFIVSVFYLRVQACCTSNPAWLFDVLLLSRIYNPELDAFYWQDIYLFISPLFESMQIILAVSSLLMLYWHFNIHNRSK